MRQSTDQPGQTRLRVDRTPFEMVPHWLLLDTAVSANAIRLYLILRKYADNETGQAYPSRRTLAQAMGVSASSVDRARSELVGAGAITEARRYSAEDREWLSNTYRVHWDRAEQGCPAGEDTPPAGGETYPASGERGIPTGGELTNTHLELRPTYPDTPPTPRPLVDVFAADEQRQRDAAGFEWFWDAYPRKAGKRAARAAYERAAARLAQVHGADHAHRVILDGARRYAADPNREGAYTAHPSTWLNQDRWEDDPLPPRAAAGRQSATSLYLDAANELAPLPSWYDPPALEA